MNAVQWVGAERRKVQWLGAVVFGVGALDATSTAQAKALLASWNATDGNNCISNYGIEASDTDVTSWMNRDGWVLSCFTNWWNINQKMPKLPVPGTKDGIGFVELDQAHLNALQQWGLSKGVINPGQIPAAPPPQTSPGTVTDYGKCLQNCAQTFTLDPIQAATCAAACAQQFGQAPQPPLPPVPPSSQPPLPAPPTPIPAPSTTTTTEKSIWPWVLGGAALIGIGALALGRS